MFIPSSFKQEYMKPIIEIPSIHAMLFAGGVKFGSKALNVTHKPSDTDVAILRDNFELMCDNSIELDINDYFNISPAYGNNGLVHHIWNKEDVLCDILILEHPEHLLAIKKAITSLNKLPTRLLLTDKLTRIHLFQKALMHYGYTNKNYILRFKRWYRGLRYDIAK